MPGSTRMHKVALTAVLIAATAPIGAPPVSAASRDGVVAATGSGAPFIDVQADELCDVKGKRPRSLCVLLQWDRRDLPSVGRNAVTVQLSARRGKTWTVLSRWRAQRGRDSGRETVRLPMSKRAIESMRASKQVVLAATQQDTKRKGGYRRALYGAQELRVGNSAITGWPLVDSCPWVPVGPGADLSSCDFTGVWLGGMDLSRANLFSARLNGADLSGSVLSSAGVVGVDLSGAVLNNARWTDGAVCVTPSVGTCSLRSADGGSVVTIVNDSADPITFQPSSAAVGQTPDSPFVLLPGAQVTAVGGPTAGQPDVGLTADALGQQLQVLGRGPGSAGKASLHVPFLPSGPGHVLRAGAAGSVLTVPLPRGQVVATALGTDSRRNTMWSVVFQGTPPAPVSVHGIRSGTAGAQVFWDEGAPLGSVPAISHGVELSVDDGLTWRTAIVSTGDGGGDAVISGLSPGTGYRFRVRTLNIFGWSQWSEPSQPVVP